MSHRVLSAMLLGAALSVTAAGNAWAQVQYIWDEPPAGLEVVDPEVDESPVRFELDAGTWSLLFRSSSDTYDISFALDGALATFLNTELARPSEVPLPSPNLSPGTIFVWNPLSDSLEEVMSPGDASLVRFRVEGGVWFLCFKVTAVDYASPSIHASSPASASLIAFLESDGTAEGAVLDLIDFVSNLGPDDFSKPNRQNAFHNKLNEVLANIQAGDVVTVCNALGQLTHDILPKTDGETPPPDWVTDPDAQQDIQAQVMAIITVLQSEANALGGCP